MTASTLVVARHGEAEYEANEWAEGGSLTPLGRRQSQALARALTGERVAHAYTSTLARAVQTAEIVAADRPPCLRALQLPLGAPGFVPPCIRHLRLPFTAGD